MVFEVSLHNTYVTWEKEKKTKQNKNVGGRLVLF